MDPDDLETRAAEARLLNDTKTLHRIACQPACPPNLLQRLAGIGNAHLTATVLRHPACPEAVLEEACRGGSNPHRILAALNPNATPDLLDRLSKLRKVRVSTAVLLNPSVLPSTAAAIVHATPRLEHLAKVLPQINDDTTWQQLDQMLPVDRSRVGHRPHTNWALCTDADVPIEILSAMAHAGIGIAQMLQHNPNAHARIVDLLPALDRHGPAFEHLVEVLAIPSLPLRAAQWLLERSLNGWKAIAKKAPKTQYVDFGFRAGTRPGEWLLLVDEAVLLPAWERAPVADLTALSAKHPRAYVGFLKNDSISTHTRETLRGRAREIGSAFIKSWPVARLLAAPAGPTAAKSTPIQAGSSLTRLPIALAAGVAARADVTPEEVRTLYQRHSKAIDAALIVAGRLTPPQVASRADPQSPTLREALALSDLTPPIVLEELVSYVVATMLDDDLPLMLLGHPRLTIEQERRILEAPVSCFYGTYRKVDPEITSRAVERAAARVTPTAQDLRNRIPRLQPLTPYLLRRTDLPVEAREAMVAASHNPWLRLLMPETRLEGLDDLLDACDATSFRAVSMGSPARQMLVDGWLFLCPELPADALERAASLLLQGTWFGDFGLGWRHLCRHPAADASLLEDWSTRSTSPPMVLRRAWPARPTRRPACSTVRGARGQGRVAAGYGLARIPKVEGLDPQVRRGRVLTDPADRVRKARVQLLFRHPFFGSLALYLEPAALRESSSTFSTDGRRFLFNPSFIAGLDDRQVEYCLAHSVLHCALEHALRRGGREQKRWDLATDLAINGMLLAPVKAGGEGMRAPKGAQLDRKLLNLSAEQIYARLPQKTRRSGAPDQHLEAMGPSEKAGEGASGSDPDSPAENGSPVPRYAETSEGIWRGRLLRAAVASRMRGELPAFIDRVLEDILEPKLPWYELLARYIQSFYRSDYRFVPPNRRFQHLGIYLPSAVGEHVSLVVAVDTSGSISNALLTRFVSELNGIMTAVSSYRIEVLACDSAVGTHRTYEAPEGVEPGGLTGGGGTDFRPVFERVEREGWAPQALVYLTDGHGKFPEDEPSYPVLWVLSEGSVDPPFGRKLVIEHEQFEA